MMMMMMMTTMRSAAFFFLSSCVFSFVTVAQKSRIFFIFRNVCSLREFFVRVEFSSFLETSALFECILFIHFLLENPCIIIAQNTKRTHSEEEEELQKRSA